MAIYDRNSIRMYAISFKAKTKTMRELIQFLIISRYNYFNLSLSVWIGAEDSVYTGENRRSTQGADNTTTPPTTTTTATTTRKIIINNNTYIPASLCSRPDQSRRRSSSELNPACRLFLRRRSFLRHHPCTSIPNHRRRMPWSGRGFHRC